MRSPWPAPACFKPPPTVPRPTTLIEGTYWRDLHAAVRAYALLFAQLHAGLYDAHFEPHVKLNVEAGEDGPNYQIISGGKEPPHPLRNPNPRRPLL